MCYYGRALMLAGSVHPSIGALLSAHQSIGVPEPVKMFGTEEQKRRFLPRCAKGAISAFLLTEPDVGSDPARLGHDRDADRGRRGYVLDGVKLWTTNGVVAELLVVMARVPKREGSRGGITRVRRRGRLPRHHGASTATRSWACEGIENGVTRFHAGPRAGREPDRPRGRGSQDRADHAQHRPAVDPGDVRGRGQVVR